MVNVPGFPAMKPLEFKRLLGKKLGYKTVPDGPSGSHETLRSPKHPDITWAFHPSKRELSPIEIRNVLVKQVGLSLDEAKEVVR